MEREHTARLPDLDRELNREAGADAWLARKEDYASRCLGYTDRLLLLDTDTMPHWVFQCIWKEYA